MRDIAGIIARLEEAEIPDTAMNSDIVHVTNGPVRPYAFSVDACLELFDTLLDGWYVAHAGDDASGLAGNMETFGHTVELSNETLTVQGCAPTRPLAWCLAVLKGYAADRAGRRSSVVERLRSESGVSEVIAEQVSAVLENVRSPFSPPDIELDDDDGSVVLRWLKGADCSFSLTFLGNGYVGGYLIHPKSKAGAWRCETSDNGALRDQLSRGGSLIDEVTKATRKG